MLDGEVPEKMDTVWGFAVPTRSGGRRKWPEALRTMAVERIAAGEGIREIAEEIGANKSLVAIWVKNAQRKDPMPALFEVVPPTEVKPGYLNWVVEEIERSGGDIDHATLMPWHCPVGRLDD